MMNLRPQKKDKMVKGNKREKKNIGVIIIFAVILSVVTIMNTLLVFRMTSNQTMDEGEFQIGSIGGELESTISNAKNLTMEVAIRAKDYLSDREKLEKFISDNKRELTEKTNGMCYNVYIAGSGWDIIPDLVKPEGFVATERSWYKGAIAGRGSVYVTSPYVDAWTGNLCYSIAMELGDGDTVLGVDYTIDNIQRYITQISESGVQEAIIVTEDGIIAGYPDETKIGTLFVNELPEYSGVLSKAKQSEGVITAKLNSGVKSTYLFATHSSSGLYLIVSKNAWELYRNSYLQLAFTIALSIALFVIILSLYLITRRNQERAEKALESKDEFLMHISKELRTPLKSIINSASYEGLVHAENFEQEINKIRNAGEELSGMLEQIVSYSTIVQKEKEDADAGNGLNKRISMRFRNTIIGVLAIVMAFSCYLNISTTYKLGHASMTTQAQNYQYQLSEWINTQKSILDMFCSIISTNPEMLQDYDYTIQYLNDITVQYPEISVTYMTNPAFEHTVMMNNGWEPEDDWHVEERQWYLDTMASADGWSISAPYYDEQTGIYCITMSESVYDAKTKEFLGNFGIDFYMDKLIDILGASYSDDGYAFLVDADGDIINHPYGAYQMSVDRVTNISELAHLETSFSEERTVNFKDYDRTYKLVISSKDEGSGFSVFVVRSIWKIYSQVVILSVLSILVFGGCLVVIFKIITDLLKWQEEINGNLKEAAEAAIAAGNAKSQFLAQMSHEIRTPINAVLGMNEMILRECDNKEIEEYAKNIQRAGTTLLTLINSILDFSKIEDGKMEIIPVNYDVASMINDLTNTIAERAAKKQLQLHVEVDEKIPAALFGDDVRVRQVITNLLTNAVKYTEKGEVLFGIREVTRSEKEVILKIEVKDTGIGIRKEDMEKLFESFQRLDEKRNRNIEGTGLGISIVTKLLHMMGSELKVESVYGKGSTFSFELVQQIANAEPIGDYSKRLETGKKKAEAERYLFAPKARILVTDDNEMNIKVVKNLMKRNGFIPDAAYSGYEAIEKVKKNTYDIIFLDHMMPKMDGIETLQMMRKENLLPECTKVIALTANAIVGAKDEYLAAGFDDYLTKPVEIARMEKKLAQHLPEEIVSYKSGQDKKLQTEAARADVQYGLQENKEGKKTPFTFEELKDWREKCPQLNVLAGLSNYTDDREAFCLAAKKFVAENKLHSIQKAFMEEQMEEYQVQLKELRGASLNIGFALLSEQVRLLEEAAQTGNVEYICQNHKNCMEEYRKCLAGIKKCIS